MYHLLILLALLINTIDGRIVSPVNSLLIRGGGNQNKKETNVIQLRIRLPDGALHRIELEKSKSFCHLAELLQESYLDITKDHLNTTFLEVSKEKISLVNLLQNQTTLDTSSLTNGDILTLIKPKETIVKPPIASKETTLPSKESKPKRKTFRTFAQITEERKQMIQIKRQKHSFAHAFLDSSLDFPIQRMQNTSSIGLLFGSLTNSTQTTKRKPSNTIKPSILQYNISCIYQLPTFPTSNQEIMLTLQALTQDIFQLFQITNALGLQFLGILIDETNHSHKSYLLAKDILINLFFHRLFQPSYHLLTLKLFPYSEPKNQPKKSSFSSKSNHKNNKKQMITSGVSLEAFLLTNETYEIHHKQWFDFETKPTLTTQISTTNNNNNNHKNQKKKESKQPIDTMDLVVLTNPVLFKSEDITQLETQFLSIPMPISKQINQQTTSTTTTTTNKPSFQYIFPNSYHQTPTNQIQLKTYLLKLLQKIIFFYKRKPFISDVETLSRLYDLSFLLYFSQFLSANSMKQLCQYLQSPSVTKFPREVMLDIEMIVMSLQAENEEY